MIECVHCHQIGIQSVDGRSHWEVCPSHPARKRIAELEAENARLREENAKLRALVKRAAGHVGCSCMECQEVEKECREALK